MGMSLRRLLYGIPLVGGIQAYCDCRRQNRLIERQNNPALDRYKIKPFAGAVVAESLSDVGAAILNFIIYYHLQPIDDWKRGAILAGSVFASYVMGDYIKTRDIQIIRNFDEKGKVTLPSKPTEIEIIASFLS